MNQSFWAPSWALSESGLFVPTPFQKAAENPTPKPAAQTTQPAERSLNQRVTKDGLTVIYDENRQARRCKRPVGCRKHTHSQRRFEGKT